MKEIASFITCLVIVGLFVVLFAAIMNYFQPEPIYHETFVPPKHTITTNDGCWFFVNESFRTIYASCAGYKVEVVQ